VSWCLAVALIEQILSVRQGLFDNLAVNHKARQVRQSLRDPVLLAGEASDGPAHPALGGGVDRLLQVRSGVQAVEHIVGKVAAMAAVQEGADQGGIRACRVVDCGERDRPGRCGVFAHGSRREDALDTVIALRRPADYSPEEWARFGMHIEKGRGAMGVVVAPFEARLSQTSFSARACCVHMGSRDPL